MNTLLFFLAIVIGIETPATIDMVILEHVNPKNGTMNFTQFVYYRWDQNNTPVPGYVVVEYDMLGTGGTNKNVSKRKITEWTILRFRNTNNELRYIRTKHYLERVSENDSWSHARGKELALRFPYFRNDRYTKLPPQYPDHNKGIK